jgi:hypothetical protein
MKTKSKQVYDTTEGTQMDAADESLIAQATFRVLISDGFADVRESLATGHKALFTMQPFQPGQVLCSFSAREILTGPTYLTVQIGANRHITLKPEFLQYMNHSCKPNTFFDTTAMQIICLEVVEPGDELTFFYPSTEWEMAQPFVCQCGQPTCLGSVSGAANLPATVLQQYRLSEFIYQQLSYAGRRST